MMNLFTPKECAANYASAGAAKTRMPLVKMFLLAVPAGFLIAMGGGMRKAGENRPPRWGRTAPV